VWQDKGLITPDGFVTNKDPEARRGRGFRDYTVYQWEGTELTILVVVEDDKVAYHYQGSGQVPWYMRWFSGL
jgi:hypothetical protein